MKINDKRWWAEKPDPPQESVTQRAENLLHSLARDATIFQSLCDGHYYQRSPAKYIEDPQSRGYMHCMPGWYLQNKMKDREVAELIHHIREHTAFNPTVLALAAPPVKGEVERMIDTHPTHWYFGNGVSQD